MSRVRVVEDLDGVGDVGDGVGGGRREGEAAAVVEARWFGVNVMTLRRPCWGLGFFLEGYSWEREEREGERRHGGQTY